MLKSDGSYHSFSSCVVTLRGALTPAEGNGNSRSHLVTFGVSSHCFHMLGGNFHRSVRVKSKEFELKT